MKASPGAGAAAGQEVEIVSPTRGRIWLDGTWDFQPAESQSVPVMGWGSIRVPGAWHRRRAGPHATDIVSEGVGAAWAAFEAERCDLAWYQRSVLIPPEWRNRSVRLLLRRVATDAALFVNGTPAGVVPWPAGSVEITRLVSPGERALLQILVLATGDEAEAARFTGVRPGVGSGDGATLEARGLIGGVWLESCPLGPHVADVHVRPVLRTQQLGVEFTLAEVAMPGTVRVWAELADEGGRVEKRFETECDARAAETQTIWTHWTWEDPRPWDPERPALYTLALGVEGRQADMGLKDVFVQRFGFREFVTEGREFLLNGVPIRLRRVLIDERAGEGGPARMDARLRAWRELGFNTIEFRSGAGAARGSVDCRDLWAGLADERGCLVIGSLSDMSPYVEDAQGRFWWDKPGMREAWERKAAAEIRSLRNHPAVILWASCPASLKTSPDADPRQLDNGATGTPGAARWAAAAQEALAIIRKYDSIRPAFVRQGGCHGDVHGVSLELGGLPLQDREEWLSRYAFAGRRPVLPLQLNPPLCSAVARGRMPSPVALGSEPWVTEFAAAYLGGRAYELEESAYREAVAACFRGGQAYAAWRDLPCVAESPALQSVQGLFVRNIWRAWRTWGLAGGVGPWRAGDGWRETAGFDERGDAPEFELLPAGEALRENNRATLAWIAGPATAFTAKDSHFKPGETVAKQVVLINDSLVAQRFTYRWEAWVKGRELTGDEDTGTIPAGATLFLPLCFETPERMGLKAEGEIKLIAAIGDDMHADAFPFRVFDYPRPGGIVPVFDPEAKTRRMLEAAGYTVTNADAQAGSNLVVIGREALSGGHALPFALGPFVREGGCALIMTQGPDWLRRQMGFRLAEPLARRVYPVSDRHPVTWGLDAADLADWSGESTLVEPYPEYVEGQFRAGPDGLPYYGWRWGSRGAVSSAAMEKPHRAGWRPILECGFDLAWSPLMELEHGRGRVVLCTLDLEDHVPQDAAAERLLHQLLKYVLQAPARVKGGSTGYAGGPEGAALLQMLGVEYEPAAAAPPPPALLVVGEDASIPVEAVEDFAAEGGRVLVLPQAELSAGFGVRLQAVTGFAGSLHPPDWPEAQGLTASDLRWRAAAPARLIAGGEGIEIGADGLLGRKRVGRGVIVFSRINPAGLEADRLTYFRFTRWRQTRALSQILANLGARFRADDYLFQLAGPPANALPPAAATPATAPRETDLYHPDYREDFALGDDPHRYRGE